MKLRNKMILLATTAAVALSAPAAAFAQSAKEVELEARLKQLEATVSVLQTELAKAKHQPDMLPAAAAAPAPAAAAAPSGPTVKFSGYVKTVGSFTEYSAGKPTSDTLRDFYLGQGIAVGNGKSYNAFTANAKQTRMTATVNSNLAGHTLTAYIEGDFQASPGAGTQNATNAYAPALRRAFVTLDNITVGQDWSTFQNPAVLPESTDYAGTLDGTVFVRQALVRYTKKISNNANFMVSLENPQTLTSAINSASVTSNDDDNVPDIAARLNFKNSIGEFSIAAVGRQLRVVNASGTFDETATGAGVSAAGAIPFGAKKQHKATFMVTYGEGIGRYMAAAATPDAITTANSLEAIATTNAFASVKFAVSPTSRINIMAGLHQADLPDVVTNPSSITKRLDSIAINYFYSPVPKVDFGVEYRHAERELFGGVNGTIDRIEFAAKYAF